MNRKRLLFLLFLSQVIFLSVLWRFDLHKLNPMGRISVEWFDENDENAFWERFTSRAGFEERWNLLVWKANETWMTYFLTKSYSVLEHKFVPRYAIENEVLNFRTTQPHTNFKRSRFRAPNRAAIISRRKFSDESPIAISLDVVRTRTESVFGLFYGEKNVWGTVEFRIKRHPLNHLPAEMWENLAMYHPVNNTVAYYNIRYVTQFIEIRLTDSKGYDQLIFQVKNKPEITKINLRIFKKVIHYHFYYTPEAGIPDLYGEMQNDRFRGSFRVGFLHDELSESRFRNLKVSTFHGQCLTEDLCQCHTGFIGFNCNIPTSSTAPEHFPPINRTVYFAQQNKPRPLDKLAQSKLFQLTHVNDTQECPSKRALFFYTLNFVGVGSVMNHMLYVLDYAYRTGRLLTDARFDEWMIARDCDTRSFSCYFHSLSECTEYNLFPARSLPDKPFIRIPIKEKMVDLEGPEDEVNRVLRFWDRGYFIDRLGYHYGWGGWDPHPLVDLVPVEFSSRDKTADYLWWRAMLTRFIARPKSGTLLIVNEAKARPEWQGYKIGVHIRGTDKINDEMFPVDLERYIEKIELLREWFNVNTIFLSTDDPDLLKRFSMETKQRGFVLMYLDESRLKEGDVPLWREEKVNNLFNATRAAEYAIANVILLSECDFFVGTFSSNMGRAAYALMIANKGRQTLGVSLDIAATERVC